MSNDDELFERMENVEEELNMLSTGQIADRLLTLQEVLGELLDEVSPDDLREDSEQAMILVAKVVAVASEAISFGFQLNAAIDEVFDCMKEVLGDGFDEFAVRSAEVLLERRRREKKARWN